MNIFGQQLPTEILDDLTSCSMMSNSFKNKTKDGINYNFPFFTLFFNLLICLIVNIQKTNCFVERLLFIWQPPPSQRADELDVDEHFFFVSQVPLVVNNNPRVLLCAALSLSCEGNQVEKRNYTSGERKSIRFFYLFL